MTAVEYMQIFRRRWRLIVLVTVCITLGAAALGPRLARDAGDGPSSYRATSTLLVRGNLTYTLQQLALLASDGAVPRSAAEKVDAEAALPSAGSVSTSIDVDGDILDIVVEDPDAGRAEALSAAIAEELIAFVGAERDATAGAAEAAISGRLQDLTVEIENLDEQIAIDPGSSVLRAQRQALVSAYALEFQSRQDPDQKQASGSITLLDTPTAVPLASESLVDVSGTLPRRLILGLVLGSLFAVGVALVVDRFDTRVRDRKSVEDSTGLPVLIELPLTTGGRGRRSTGLVFGPHYNGPLAERFRSFRSALLFVESRESSSPTRPDVAHDGRLEILVCSPGASTVRSITAANLAAAFAESGRSVVLVTGQRVPGSSADLLLGESHNDAADGFTTDIDRVHEALLSTEIAGLQVLDLRLLAIERGQLGKLLARLDTAAEVVVFDVPPLLTSADAMEFLPFASVAVLVVRAGRTRLAAVSRAAELLRLGRVPVVAPVLVSRRRPRRLGSRPAGAERPNRPVNVVPERRSSAAPKVLAPVTDVGPRLASRKAADQATSVDDRFGASGQADRRASPAPASSTK